MLVIAIGRMGLLQLKKNNSIKHQNNRAGFFLKKRVLFCCFKTKKNMFFLKKNICFKTRSHL